MSGGFYPVTDWNRLDWELDTLGKYAETVLLRGRWIQVTPRLGLVQERDLLISLPPVAARLSSIGFVNH